MLLETIEKLLPVETVLEVGETVKFEGNAATTRLDVLMLTTTLAVAPPFFLIATLDEDKLIVQEGGPELPGTPCPDTSKQGVLSITVEPDTVVWDLMLVFEFIVVYVMFGSVGC